MRFPVRPFPPIASGRPRPRSNRGTTGRPALLDAGPPPSIRRPDGARLRWLAALALALAWIGLLPSTPARADVVYANDFELGATDFVAGGVISTLDRTMLPVDGGGLSSPNQSTWLGRIGAGIAETPTGQQIVGLTLPGLTPGHDYTVAFDLFIGASWDGAASCWGPDAWYFAVDGNRLVDTMFSNGDQGVDYGAYSPQRYSDTHYTDPGPPDVGAFTGSEFFKKEGPGYSGYYGIYYFGRGAGNPTLSFIASSSTATLQWARYRGADSGCGASDEYWALDNVVVEDVPEPAATPMLAAGVFALAWTRVHRRRG